MRIIFYQRATANCRGRLVVQSGDETFTAEVDIKATAPLYNGDVSQLSDMAFRQMKEKITTQLWASAQQGRY